MNTGERLLLGFVLIGLLVAAGMAVLTHGNYGWTIFLVFPMLLGGLASWVRRPSSALRAMGLGAVTVTLAIFSLLAFDVEGLGCIVMALPLAIPMGMIGSWLVYRAQSHARATHLAAILLLLPPATFTWDVHAQPEVFAVRTAIEVAAPPDVVWKHVVTFPDLAEPTEWYFRGGIAYPKRARIEGIGPGAIRYCEFSTGPFVEPIEVWDEARLLRFRVTDNPAPMQEWSPYSNLQPKHLHGYMISKQGQFQLTPLRGNRTLLEGTTWYQHGLWPAQYWRWWSDAIIHRIHLQVLNHVRTLSERGGTDDRSTSSVH